MYYFVFNVTKALLAAPSDQIVCFADHGLALHSLHVEIIQKLLFISLLSDIESSILR